MANYIRAKVPLDAAAVTAVFCFHLFRAGCLDGRKSVSWNQYAPPRSSGREQIFAPFARSRSRFADKKWTRAGL
jgi:hypothetical protein